MSPSSLGHSQFPARHTFTEGMPLRIANYTPIILGELPPNRGFLLSSFGTTLIPQTEIKRQTQAIASPVVQHLPSYHLCLLFCTRSEHATGITSLFCTRNEHSITHPHRLWARNEHPIIATIRRDPSACKCLRLLELTSDFHYGKNPIDTLWSRLRCP